MGLFKQRPVVAVIIVVSVLVAVLMALSFAASMFLNEAPVVASDKVALVRVEGVILDSRDVVEQLRKYAKNDSVKAIVIRIDSPGGAVVPSQEIYEEIRKITTEKKQKVITSMGSVAASGGYYIAAATDRIIANPGTLTGSIGVIMEFASAEELMSKIGLKSEVVKSGARKDIGNFMRSMTPEEKEYLQKVLDDVHDQFIDAVAEGRRMKKEDVVPLADGSVFTGRQAKDYGLVDEMGDLQDAIVVAGKLGGIQGEPKVLEEQKKYSIWDLLRGEDMGNIFRGLFRKNFQSLLFLYAAPEMR